MEYDLSYEMKLKAACGIVLTSISGVSISNCWNSCLAANVFFLVSLDVLLNVKSLLDSCLIWIQLGEKACRDLEREFVQCGPGWGCESFTVAWPLSWVYVWRSQVCYWHWMKYNFALTVWWVRSSLSGYVNFVVSLTSYWLDWKSSTFFP